MASVNPSPTSRVLFPHEPLLQVHGVNHTFGKETSANQVLYDIELEVLPGELVILAGISGCGKTTLLTLIGGLRRLQGPAVPAGTAAPTRPNIGIWNAAAGDYDWLLGMTEADLVRLRQRIGFIFQRHNLFDSLTAAENVRMSQQLHPDDPERWRRLTEAVRAPGLDPTQRSQPLTEAQEAHPRLADVLALGGRVQPEALVLPLTADAAFEARLGQAGWQLEPTALPLPRPADPAVMARLRKRGFGIDADRLILPADIQASDWMALRELGLRFGGRRLPLIGSSIPEWLRPFREGPHLLLPASPDQRVEALLTEIGLHATDHALRLPEDALPPKLTRPLSGPLVNLLDQLRLRFHQGSLALPPGTDGDLLKLLLALDFTPETDRLVVKPTGSIFAIQLLRTIGVPVERQAGRDAIVYSIPLPRGTAAETVAEFVDLWKRLRPVTFPARNLIHANPARLSGGQRQRVAICRALINNPLLILADEPTAALDPERKLQVIELLKAQALLTGTTSLVVTHDENITRHADRIVTMVQGRIASNVVVAEEEFVYNALRVSAPFAALPTGVQRSLAMELLLGVHPTHDVPREVRLRCPWFESHPPGAEVVRQGDRGNLAYLIRSGEVEVLRQGAEGGPLLPVCDDEGRPVILGPGKLFGDQAVLRQSGRNATVRVIGDRPLETYNISESQFALHREVALPLIKTVLDVYGRGGRVPVGPLTGPSATDEDAEGTNAGGN